MAAPIVLLTDPIAREGTALLEAAGCTVRRAEDRSPQGLRAACAGADAVIVRSWLPEDAFVAAPRMLAAVRHGVGVDMIPIPEASAAGVLVSRVPGANAATVAEFAVGQMLAAARGVEALDAAHRSEGWEKARARTAQGTELLGRTLGLVGVGDIGMHLARIAHHGFGMRVLGFRRDAARLPPHVAYAPLPELFAEADYIVIACPLTDETRGLIGAALIGRMKRTAWLINVARGPIIDEAALIEALAERRIGGAALDVYATHPLPTDHPLLALPNVIATPHGAGISRESGVALAVRSAEEVLRVLRGERPLALVNPEALARHNERRAVLGLGAIA
ncbi:MAG: hydroxyacid dehydrogenase [Acetobacteraceae bacterium]|jgi:D-3-phosphoglycerate dehydrogenase|nr:hydroxyacid dehydrogenase [Acetobacteraceae bacterium]